MEKTIIKVEGMSCSHCVNAVTKAVSSLEGVSQVQVNLEEKTAVVEYDPSKIALDVIKAAIEEEGYDVA